MVTTRVSRNDLCPCRSGKKFKNCCLLTQPPGFGYRPSGPASPLLQPPGSLVAFPPRSSAARPTITTPLEKRSWREVHVALVEADGDLVFTVLLHSTEWLRSRNVTIGGVFQLCIPQFEVRGAGRVAALKNSTTVPECEGMVVTFVREERHPREANLPPMDRRSWQQVHVVLDEPDGAQVRVVMLHSLEWILLHNSPIGGPCYLNLPQHGIHGAGRHMFVEPSPMVSDSEGRVVAIVRQDKIDAAGSGAGEPSFSFSGLSTYVGEQLPPLGSEWVQLPLKCEIGRTSNLTLTRPIGWLHANRGILGRLRRDELLTPEAEDCHVIHFLVSVQNGQPVRTIFFAGKQWIEACGLAIGESVYFKLPDHDLHGEGHITAIAPAPRIVDNGDLNGATPIAKASRNGLRTIGSLQVGEYVQTFSPEEHGVKDLPDPRAGEWVPRERVRLHLDKDDGGEVDVVLLRELGWLESVETAGAVHLEMPEMGTTGWAEVRTAETCLVFKLPDHPGLRMITGTFRHSAGRAGDLKLKGEANPLGVTPGHLFWSADRLDWISVGDLLPGERVKTVKGMTTVESYALRDRPEPVNNLEVERDHVYRVGECGALVHNTSTVPLNKEFGCERRSGSGSSDCTSKKLWDNIGGKDPDWQPHHLIPCVLRERGTYQVLEHAEKLGFDFNGTRNGLRLPFRDAAFAQKVNLPLHRGRPIDEYIACMEPDLDALETAFKGGKLNDCQICPLLYAIADKYKAALKSIQIWLSHNDLNKKGVYKCP